MFRYKKTLFEITIFSNEFFNFINMCMGSCYLNTVTKHVLYFDKYYINIYKTYVKENLRFI